ncbi:MAG: class I SAM-dependent methyltransferase [Burkholderiales bacterium]
MTTNPHAPRWEFYRRVVDRLIPDRSASVLVVCAGRGDKRLLEQLGFTNVTISNLAEAREDFAPFVYAREDAENLSFGDDAFDYVLVHAGLHHCQSPHRALLEMVRVCRSGALVFEARDSLLMRVAARLGLTYEYEIEAVARGGAGMRDTGLPNYVYRWTEREVEKMVRTYRPQVAPRIRFFYGLSLPAPDAGGRSKRIALRVLGPFARAFVKLFPRQGNLFAFLIEKPAASAATLHRWLELEDGRIGLRKDARGR